MTDQTDDERLNDASSTSADDPLVQRRVNEIFPLLCFSPPRFTFEKDVCRTAVTIRSKINVLFAHVNFLAKTI